MFMRSTLFTAASVVFALPLTASAAPVIFQAAGRTRRRFKLSMLSSSSLPYQLRRSD